MSGTSPSGLVIGYHASHEQLPPSELLRCVAEAEAAGVQAGMGSDPFAPWGVRGAAALSEMFPGRFWLALGSGEASNEHITGDRWPAKAERRARLGEAVAVIRALLAGETVSHDGLVTVD